MAVPEDENTKLNPGQTDYDQKVNNIDNAEKAGSFDDSGDKSVPNAEENPDGPWINSTGQDNRVGPVGAAQVAGRLSGLKKKGPIGIISGIILLGVFGLSSIIPPALMLVQGEESVVGRLNTQLTSMTTRTGVLNNSKINGTTSGVCTSVVSIECKFSSMSDKQVEKFRVAGVDVVESPTTTITGRVKPKSFVFNGETIDAKDFSKKISSDANFSSAVKKAYNPKFAGFADNVWAKISAKLGISKVRALPEGDSNAKSKAIAEETKSGFSSLQNDGISCPAGETSCYDTAGKKLDDAASAEARQAKKDLAAAAGATDHAATAAIEDAASTAKNAAKAGVSGVGNFFKLTGALDASCSVYTAVQTLGYAAKTVRAVQLARYAIVFLNTADQIRAGTATPEDVAYLGGIFTSVAIDAKTGVARKAAMDSFGMKYAEFGEVGKADSYVSQFMAGGGLTGDLINLTTMINSSLDTTPRATCAALNNGFVQAGSLIGGVALLLVPGVDVVVTAADIAKAGASIAATVAISVLPSLLKDIVAGTVTKGLVGEDAGNAFASGAGKIMSDVSQGGGNGTMSVDDAIAYNSEQNKVLAQYAAEDRATLSPFDVTSQNTFMGSIVAKLLPNISQMSSLSGSLSAIGSIVSGSLSSIVPKSSALTQDELKAAYTVCNDMDYKTLDIATDPFCNPIYGIPPQYLNKDPVKVADELIKEGSIDDAGAVIPGSKYEDYLNNCVNRAEPMGCTGDSGTGNDGMMCKVKADNINYYLFTIDSRIDNGMDGTATQQNSSTASSTAANSGALIGDVGKQYLSCAAWIDQFVLPTYFGIANPGGDGKDAAPYLGTKDGYVVNHTPAVHSIVSWPSGGVAGGKANSPAGHVAIVYQVNADGSIEVEEHNYTVPSGYDKRHISAAVANLLTYAHTEAKFK